jgi:serine/threonine protein kinase
MAARRIASFALEPGHILAGKYRVESLLGAGWEGEVYKIVELGTGIERAAKLFFPHRNPRNTTARRYALKLHKLRHCGILIQYYTQEFVRFEGQRVSILISEFVEGELLGELLKRQRGRALTPFEALHLLHALAAGIAHIHMAREYHGDLHTENVIVRRYGLGFQVKVIDLFHWVTPRRENIQADVCDLIRIFYDSLGGARRYRFHRPEIKAICCGLKRSLILSKFRTAGQIRDYLESIDWN